MKKTFSFLVGMKHTNLTLFMHNGLLSQWQKGIVTKFKMPREYTQTWTHILYIDILPPYLCTTAACYYECCIYKEIEEKQTLAFFCLKFIFLKLVASQCQYFLFLSFAQINDTNSHIKAQNKVNYKAAKGTKSEPLYAYGVQKYSIGNERW